MDLNLLPFYAIGAMLCFLQGMCLVTFALRWPSATASRKSAGAMICLSLAFFGSAIGPALPRWATVIGTNVLYLCACVLLLAAIVELSGIARQRQLEINRVLALASTLPFAYWGLWAPNGTLRSLVFSVIAAAINAQSAWLLFRPPLSALGRPARILGGVLSLIAASLTGRVMILTLVAPSAAEQAGSNPTSWGTVFWFILLVSALSAAILWLDVRKSTTIAGRAVDTPHRVDEGDAGQLNIFLVWALTGMLGLAIVSEVGLAYAAVFEGGVPVIEQHVSPAYQAFMRVQPLVWGAALTLVFLLAMAMVLTTTLRHRDEYKNFLSMLSHELKTPLATIGMSITHLDIPAASRQRLQRSVDSMSAIIDRCLLADRIDSNRCPIRVEACALTPLLTKLVESCPDADRVRLDVEEAAEVRTDTQLVTVIIANLLDNALKYGAGDAPVEIGLRSAPSGGKDGARIEIANAPGPAGLPDANQVFRKYYRAPGAHSRIGSGLGLHIASALAQRLGGHLRYSPTTHQVIFELWIPA